MAAQVWGAGGGPPAYAIVKINGDGSADVLTGTQDLGTGSRTILAQIAAESLGARLAGRAHRARRHRADAVHGPIVGIDDDGVGRPGGARVAAEDALRQLLEAASEVLDVHRHG